MFHTHGHMAADTQQALLWHSLILWVVCVAACQTCSSRSAMPGSQTTVTPTTLKILHGKLAHRPRETAEIWCLTPHHTADSGVCVCGTGRHLQVVCV